MKVSMCIILMFLGVFIMMGNISADESYMTQTGKVDEVYDGDIMTDSGKIEGVGPDGAYMMDSGKLGEVTDDSDDEKPDIAIPPPPYEDD